MSFAGSIKLSCRVIANEGVKIFDGEVAKINDAVLEFKIETC